MILRAKTKYLFDKFPLTERQRQNTDLNVSEAEMAKTVLKSYPRRLALELTNACNLRCVMCGRNAADFTPTFFKLDWLKKFEPILNDIEEVSLFGWGEPTVHPEFVKILEYLDSFNVRKYFCTNGMRLDYLTDAIFKYNVDIIAISLDGAKKETNDRIRRGGDFDKITKSLKEIVRRKKAEGLNKPYMNFVFCAMGSNYKELPELVKLAADIGLEEVKAVYFTAFEKEQEFESLWGMEKEVAQIFQNAVELGKGLNVSLKLPFITGEDSAEKKAHRDCFVGWRDLFLGSDGFVRPCMSTPDKFFRFEEFETFGEIWNHERFQEFRAAVNDAEKMPQSCRNCYQSSHCNWNKKESFIQTGMKFAPMWEKD